MMRLVIAPLNYSSWSVRAWLALDHSGADFKTHEIALFVDPGWRENVLRFSGAGKVPVLVDANLGGAHLGATFRCEVDSARGEERCNPFEWP